MKDKIKIIAVIIGTLIGAGFASGQEIYLFFSRYYENGLLGIVFSCFLTGMIIYGVFSIVQRENIQNYQEFLQYVMSNKQHSKPFLVQCFYHMVTLFLLVSFYIMIAGFSAYFHQQYQVPIWLGSSIIAGICYLTINKHSNGLIKMNTILIPVLIMLVIHIGLKNVDFFYHFFENHGIHFQISVDWWISSLLYTSYNSILLIPILISLQKQIKEKKDTKKISFLVSIVLGILAFLIVGLLLRGNDKITAMELPLLEISKSFGRYAFYLYGIVIVFSIFTSAISAGYAFLENSAKGNEKNYKRISFAICITSIFIAPMGFSNLVAILYPFFGVLGIFQIVPILWKTGKNKRKNCKKRKKLV